MSASFLGRIQRRVQPPKTNLDLLVVSHGGSGSTLLANYLGDYMKLNSPISTNDGLLHCCTPDHPLVKCASPKRIIYCYDDPRLSVISLFRRNLHIGMQAKLRYFGESPHEYRKMCAGYDATVKSLDDFFEKQYDCFGINSFWRNWTGGWTGAPLMLLSYESMWDNLDRILAFSEIRKRHNVASFPVKRERKSSLEDLPASRIRILNRIYSQILTEMSDLPPVVVRS